jgi:hypothetical protein
MPSPSAVLLWISPYSTLFAMTLHGILYSLTHILTLCKNVHPPLLWSPWWEKCSCCSYHGFRHTVGSRELWSGGTITGVGDEGRTKGPFSTFFILPGNLFHKWASMHESLSSMEQGNLGEKFEIVPTPASSFHSFSQLWD